MAEHDLANFKEDILSYVSLDHIDIRSQHLPDPLNDQVFPLPFLLFRFHQ